MTSENLLTTEPLDSQATGDFPVPLSAVGDGGQAPLSVRGIYWCDNHADAENCIVIGALDQVEGLDFGKFREVLWFHSKGSRWPERFSVNNDRVRALEIEGLSSAGVCAAIHSLIQRDWNQLPAVFVTEAASKGRPYLEAIRSGLKHLKEQRTMRIVACSERGIVRQRHVLQNLTGYIETRVPRAWHGAMRGVPAFICGAGPSLDPASAALRRLAPSGLVFSADSAARVLHKHGIGIDFLSSMDERKNPKNCVPLGMTLPILLANLFSSPEWRHEVLPGRLFFVSGDQSMEEWLEGAGVPRTSPRFIGNCGITAFTIASYLGCSPICLFGMDHAVDGKNSTRLYSCDASQELQRTAVASDRPPMLPGNYQDKIATTGEFAPAWRALDELCAALPPGVVYNVTDRGARFRNTTVVHPDKFAIEVPDLDKVGILGGLSPAASVTKHDGKKLRRRIDEIASAADLALVQAREFLDLGRGEKAISAISPLFKDDKFRFLFGNWRVVALKNLQRAEQLTSQEWREFIETGRELCAIATSLGRGSAA